MPIEDEETLGAFEGPPRFPTAGNGRALRSAAEDPNLGRRIGPYRLERLLGRGGMGVIYLAAREDDFEQQVALKLIDPGLETAEVLRRFYKERQILAHLQHPSIARILDGGTTDDALPYFVMEYIEGRPVDCYCREHDLSLRQRLELFREICAVVHFAHQNLVVHRDLKPGNILVTAEGVPKLLDFGIAKILRSTNDAFDTQSDRRPMTPDYASPEQILGGPITTGSDVYSLGVLLYLLVAGRPPHHFEGCGPARMAEIVCRQDPVPPSEATGRRRGLAGDVDAIVLKAMRKKPQERYASVLQLAEDVELHLADLPVKAHHGTWISRLRKFARRRKLAVAIASAILALGLVTTVLWRQAVDQRRLAEASQSRAEAAQLRAERVSGFLEELFKAADPDAARGETVTARAILDRGRENLAGKLEREPEVRAELLTTLGTVYNNLGLYREARELKEEALETRRASDPADGPDLAADLNNLGRLEYDMGEFAEAEGRFREALAMWRRLGDEANVALVLRNLAAVEMNQGRYEDAASLYGEVLEIQRKLPATSDEDFAKTLHSLGTLHRLRGDLQDAERLLRQALDLFTRSYGRRHTRVASVLGSLGHVLHEQGRYAEAKECYVEALDIRRRLLGEDHVQVAISRKNLAALLLDLGDTEGARKLLEPALETLRRDKPAGDWTLADAESVWGSYLAAMGRYEEAEPFVVSGYRTLRGVKGGRDADTRAALQRAIALYEAWGRKERVEELRAGMDDMDEMDAMDVP